jgi:hypothetical protein
MLICSHSFASTILWLRIWVEAEGRLYFLNLYFARVSVGSIYWLAQTFVLYYELGHWVAAERQCGILTWLTLFRPWQWSSPKENFTWHSHFFFFNLQGLLGTDPVPEEGEDAAATLSATETLSEEEQDELRRELAKVKELHGLHLNCNVPCASKAHCNSSWLAPGERKHHQLTCPTGLD